MNKTKNTNAKSKKSSSPTSNTPKDLETHIPEKSENTVQTVEDPRSPLEKKTHRLLKTHGMLDGYKYVLANICKDGLPEGDIFEYAAFLFSGYEKKWKALKSKEVKEKIKIYKEEKLAKIKQKGKLRTYNLYYNINNLFLMY